MTASNIKNNSDSSDIYSNNNGSVHAKLATTGKVKKWQKKRYRFKKGTGFKKTQKPNLLPDLPDVILNTAKDIISIKIQGATNVAIETFKALRNWLEQSNETNKDKLLAKYERYASVLSSARANEPLAKNGVKFVSYYIKTRYSGVSDVKKLKKALIDLSQEYLDLIASIKKDIVKNGTKYIAEADILVTHCHSSTVENLIASANDVKKKKVIATETRPLFQGHITVKNLLKRGVDTVMVVDGAAPYFIRDDSVLPVDAVLIGSDEITVMGNVINKVGSYAIAISAYFSAKPLYIVTPSLKIDMSTIYNPVQIELREGKEVWPDAPKNLKVINPAFDLVSREFITGFITEFGLVKPRDLETMVREHYPWIS